MPRLRRLVPTALGAVLLLVAYFTLPYEKLDVRHPALAWTIFTVVLAGLGVATAYWTVRALTVETGRPGVWIMLLSLAALLTFAACYRAMATFPGEFKGDISTRLDALYFMVITLATVGYGDITPSGQVARAVVVIQLLYSFSVLAAGLTAVTARTRKQVTEKLGPSRH
jgi:hypothetical protein